MKKNTWLFVLGAIALLLLAFITPQIFLIIRSQSKIATSIEQISPHQRAIVFGARVYRNQVMSDAVRERTKAGVLLYQADKVQQLYITADNSNNAEATTMAEFAISNQIPAEALLIDPEGKNTLSSCKHFADEPSQSTQVILISQQFHLPRAIAMCEHQGLTVTGLAANKLNILPNRGKNQASIVRIRVLRFLRESSLTWAYLLGLYQKFSL